MVHFAYSHVACFQRSINTLIGKRSLKMWVGKKKLQYTIHLANQELCFICVDNIYKYLERGLEENPPNFHEQLALEEECGCRLWGVGAGTCSVSQEPSPSFTVKMT